MLVWTPGRALQGAVSPGLGTELARGGCLLNDIDAATGS